MLQWVALELPQSMRSSQRCSRSYYDSQVWDQQPVSQRTLRFGSTAKVLAECMLKYYRISRVQREASHDPK